MDSAVEHALKIGFSQVGTLDCDTLIFLPEVRDMCRVDKCKMYNKSWTCPPACGELDECEANAKTFDKGIIVQTTSILEDSFDYEGMVEGERVHKSMFVQLLPILKADFPDAFPLGAGGCHLCEPCTYPDSPCTHPDKAFTSMEAYGLWVSDVCEKNNIRYYYGENTMTYTSCYLLTKKVEDER